MARRIIFLSVVSLLLCSEFVWAQKTVAREDDRAARKQWEEDQRADEYANSLRRRDWLKDRLILEIGAGTKFPAMGANWFGFGAGVEYITRWHVSAFLSGGFIPPHEDPIFNEDPKYSLEGGTGWRFGVAYYLLPKNPIHLGIQASYGTVFYDHEAKPNDDDNVRRIITCNGYEFDITVSYLSDQWYFLQAIVGIYTIGNGIYGGGQNTWGRTNDSWRQDYYGNYISKVTTNEDNNDEAIPPWGVVFGISIGFAFEEFFPDDTELRRRERESSRSKQSQFRSTPTRSVPASKSSRRASSRVVEEEPAEEEE